VVEQKPDLLVRQEDSGEEYAESGKPALHDQAERFTDTPLVLPGMGEEETQLAEDVIPVYDKDEIAAADQTMAAGVTAQMDQDGKSRRGWRRKPRGGFGRQENRGLRIQ